MDKILDKGDSFEKTHGAKARSPTNKLLYRGVGMLSGDSTVKSFSFDGKMVKFECDDCDSDRLYNVQIETAVVYSEVESGENSVHMRLVPGEEVLEIDANSGRYILPGTFSKQMAAINNGYHVLAGLRSKEFTHVFVLASYKRLIVCPIKGPESVRVTAA